MQTLELPASVKGRACFAQFIGALAVDQAYFDQALAQINKVGMPAIWAANDKNPPSLYNPSVLALAAALSTQGVDMRLPEALEGQEFTDEAGIPAYVISKGIAIIPVNGPLSKQSSSLNSLFGGSNTVGMRKALALAMGDSRVERIMFHIDSPGGTVAGTGDLGDDILEASTKKPIASYIEDMGTSAAYWLAAQTETIYASVHANVGSIGVIWTVYDTSGAYEKDGIKVHAITSSPGKAFYVDGMPITKQQLAKMQAYVDSTYARFLNAVAKGRGVSMEEARTMSGDADIYDSETAMEKGLVDGIMQFRAALEDFHAVGAVRKGVAMRNRKRSKRGYAEAVVAGDFVALNPVEDLAAVSAADAGDSGFSSGTDIVALEESPVTPEPQPAGTKAAAPVSLTPEAHADLVAKAELGAKAHEKFLAFEAKQNAAAVAALDSERERIMADYGLPKERVQACPDVASLRALEATAREGQKAGGRKVADPVKVQAEQQPVAEFDAWGAHFASTEGQKVFGAPALKTGGV